MNLKLPGNTRLVGEISPSGSVFSAITLVAASLLFTEEVVLENVPQVNAFTKFLINLKDLGSNYSWVARNTLAITTATISGPTIIDPILIPVMLGRFGEFKIAKNLFSTSLTGWLADVGVELEATSSEVRGSLALLKPLNLNLENSLESSLASLILASKIAEESNLTNYLITEETLDLISFLKEAGVSVIEDSKIPGNVKIQGLPVSTAINFNLHASSFESGFWIAAAIVSNGDLKIINPPKERLISLMSKLTTMGVTFDFSGSILRVWRDSGSKLLPIDFELSKTQFLYDFLPILIPILLMAGGTSKITGIDLNTELSLSDINLFNAKIYDKDIVGPASLKGAKVVVPNFAGGVTLLLAALGASSRSELLEAEKILDYFDGFEIKLKSTQA